jgi:hypothetical protein
MVWEAQPTSNMSAIAVDISIIFFIMAPNFLDFRSIVLACLYTNVNIQKRLE